MIRTKECKKRTFALTKGEKRPIRFKTKNLGGEKLPHDHLLLDSASNIGPLLSCWELDKFKNS
jgi:hypothetical protein